MFAQCTVVSRKISKRLSNQAISYGKTRFYKIWIRDEFRVDIPCTNPWFQERILLRAATSVSTYHWYYGSYCSYLLSPLAAPYTNNFWVYHIWQSANCLWGNSEDTDLYRPMPAPSPLTSVALVHHCAKYTGTGYYPSEYQPIHRWKYIQYTQYNTHTGVLCDVEGAFHSLPISFQLFYGSMVDDKIRQHPRKFSWILRLFDIVMNVKWHWHLRTTFWWTKFRLCTVRRVLFTLGHKI